MSSQSYFYDLGYHRVLDPPGTQPQLAWRLDNTPIARATETLVDVHLLYLDASSFAQIAQACNHSPEHIKAHIQEIVQQRGKMHNPVTGSGGVLLGKVVQIDEISSQKYHVFAGDTIVSLTSLSWLPLFLEKIHTIYPGSPKVVVEGKAIFFRCNPLIRLPDDLPTSVSVAALDVAGAPTRAAEMIRPGQHVTILGAGGTAGLLTLCAARRRLGESGKIMAIEVNAAALEDIAQLGYADLLVQGDATRPLQLLEQVSTACNGQNYEADLTINVVNVPHTELASILLTRTDGRILFFSMVTSFSAAALSAEGIARATEMHIGNGYMPYHGQVALQLLRDHPTLLTIFKRRFDPA